MLFKSGKTWFFIVLAVSLSASKLVGEISLPWFLIGACLLPVFFDLKLGVERAHP